MSHTLAIAAREFRVIHLAAADDLILQQPGLRGFGIFLHVARHHRVAASADGHVE